MKIDHIYCINLERSKDRRLNMENQFEKLGLDVEFFKACDGKEVGKDGKFGCGQSHLWIYDDILKKGYNNAIIFEDDAILCSNLKEEIEELPEPPEDWDIFYLIKYAEIKESTVGIFNKGKCLSTSGYIISNKGCSKVSNFRAEDIGHIDVFLANLPLKSYYIDKSFGICNLPGGFSSTIGFNWDLECYFYFFRFIIEIFKCAVNFIIKKSKKLIDGL